MNLQNIKLIHALSKETGGEIYLYKHNIPSRKEAQDLIQSISDIVGVPYQEEKNEEVRWFLINSFSGESIFKVRVFFKYSEAEKEQLEEVTV